ncbi:MAG TPA: nuclear transport factor 2 family protein [Candidatus Saccharimonadales bacterium]|nr:nuclear transport factor 2 family protein [Candidatus Saccharimonadales bacterium]
MSDPESVVQRQLDAYNSRDIDALMSTYAEDAEIFEHPSKLVGHGAAQLRERFTLRFKEPNLHAHLQKRIVMGHIVIDHELVTRTFPEGPGTLECVMIYEIQNGRIAKAWSIAGAKILDAKA